MPPDPAIRRRTIDATCFFQLSRPLLFFILCPVQHSYLPSPTVLRTDMRRDVQEIFRATPHHKQVMMFSATLAKEIRATCKKFMTNVSLQFVFFTPYLAHKRQPLEIFVDDETKLTLHGLQQYYVKLDETAKKPQTQRPARHVGL